MAQRTGKGVPDPNQQLVAPRDGAQQSLAMDPRLTGARVRALSCCLSCCGPFYLDAEGFQSRQTHGYLLVAGIFCLEDISAQRKCGSEHLAFIFLKIGKCVTHAER